MTKKQSNCDGGSFFGGAAAGARSRVWFGGTYQEHWSDDYRLLVSYSGRAQVDCVFDGHRWQPAGGDAALCERLLREQDEPFLQRYFQAAAQAYFSAQNCLERGLPLSALYECYPCGADSLCAAELLRLCLDDCGMRLEDALPSRGAAARTMPSQTKSSTLSPPCSRARPLSRACCAIMSSRSLPCCTMRDWRTIAVLSARCAAARRSLCVFACSVGA